jgi:tetratricopeptide (TPR) repeat protein
MSLSKDKASLFSTGPSAKPKAKPAGGAASGKPAPAPAPVAMAPAPVIKTRGGAIPALSAEAKARKLAEARDCSDKGTKSLQTSVFQWSPDYVLAAPYFERAGECYKIAGEFKLARLMFLQTAEAHEKLGANAAAALTYLKAANISQMENNFSGAAELFQQSAQQWMLQGDAKRAADAFDKAAAELESVSEAAAAEAYARACSMIFPEETPESQHSNVSANAIEIFRNHVRFNLNHQRYKQTIPLLDRLALLYLAFDLQSGMCKMMLAVTLIQLQQGDLVGADNTFLQKHLNNSVYLKSNESAVAESFLNAFKNYDIEALDKARSPTSVMYVDPDFQDFARNLSFMGAGHMGGKSAQSSKSEAKPASKPAVAVAVAASSAATAVAVAADVAADVAASAPAIDASEDLQTSLENVTIGDDADVGLTEEVPDTEQQEELDAGAVEYNYGADDDDDDINLC